MNATQKPLADLCDEYLQNRHCVLWGTAHEVLTTKGRQAAAEWFASQLEQFMDETGMRLVPKTPVYPIILCEIPACPNGVNCTVRSCPNTHPPMTAARLDERCR